MLAWTIEYDRLGSRLRRIGPYQLSHRVVGNRIETIGPMYLRYDRLGTRVARVALPGEVAALDEDLLVVLFFVLDHVRRQQDAAARRQAPG